MFVNRKLSVHSMYWVTSHYSHHTSYLSPEPGLHPAVSVPSDQRTMASDGSLAHLSWLCPGMHGKESRQTILRRTFRQLFREDKRLIIPLIQVAVCVISVTSDTGTPLQRRYCWNQQTVWKWFEVRQKL